MLNPKRIMSILLVFVFLGLIVKFSYFYLIGQEGNKYFSIIKGIIQLKATDDKIVKISSNPDEFIFNANDIKEIEELVKSQGFQGEEYYKSFMKINQDKLMKTQIRMFSRKYIILTYTIIDKSD